MAKLSAPQRRLVAYMQQHGETIHRHPGGFWAHAAWRIPQDWFPVNTVAALVRQGEAEFTEYQKAGAICFAIKAQLRHSNTGSERCPECKTFMALIRESCGPTDGGEFKCVSCAPLKRVTK